MKCCFGEERDECLANANAQVCHKVSGSGPASFELKPTCWQRSIATPIVARFSCSGLGELGEAGGRRLSLLDPGIRGADALQNANNVNDGGGILKVPLIF
jgi:hypothetical protein